MEKTKIELCGKLPFLGSSKEVSIDFDKMEIEAKEGLKNIPIFKVKGLQLFTMRYLMPILIIAVFLQLGLNYIGVIAGSLLYLFLSGLSGIFNGTKHKNIIVSIFAIPIPLFFLYLSFNNVKTDFNIYELQGSLYAAFAGMMLFEFLLIDMLHKKYNDIYRTISLSNFIILKKEPKRLKLIFQKVIVFIVSIIVMFFAISSLSEERANAVILAHQTAIAQQTLHTKIEAEKAAKREIECQKMDKKLASSSKFQNFKDEIKLYANHRVDESILDYDIINTNATTKLMNLKTGEIHTLPSDFKSGHFMKKSRIKVKSNLEREFVINKKGTFAIVKTFANKEKKIAGNFYHIHDAGEEFAIITRQAEGHELSRVERARLLRA